MLEINVLSNKVDLLHSYVINNCREALVALCDSFKNERQVKCGLWRGLFLTNRTYEKMIKGDFIDLGHSYSLDKSIAEDFFIHEVPKYGKNCLIYLDQSLGYDLTELAYKTEDEILNSKMNYETKSKLLVKIRKVISMAKVESEFLVIDGKIKVNSYEFCDDNNLLKVVGKNI